MQAVAPHLELLSATGDLAHVRGAVSPFHRVDEDLLLGQFIPLHYHAQMLDSEARMIPFEEAISKLVPEGANVVELGGGTGVLSFFAARKARHVTLVERLPHVAAAARRLLAQNGVADKVTVVEADARGFVPDEPVDVLLCEMLHVGLLREKQVQVLAAFKSNHIKAFGKTVPRILPEASILAVQPVYVPFNFHGYVAPIPYFEYGGAGSRVVEMGEPSVYSIIDYVDELPFEFCVRGDLRAERAGTVNALRFITKVPVGIFPQEGRSADWVMQYLCLPLSHPVPCNAGDELEVSFQYEPGGSIESLQASLGLRAARLARAI